MLRRVLSSSTVKKLTQKNAISSPSYRPFSIITIEESKKMAKNYNELPNDVLVTLAVTGDQEAREERLIREIMSVDNTSWKDSQSVFTKMLASNRNGLFIATLPYKIGIATAIVSGFLSIPMIFHLETVLTFNELFVTTDVPDDKDLETPLEIGGWAWNWMEPPLGTISFFLLCTQYARSQMENLGAKPYTAWYKARRSNRLCREFPQYNQLIVSQFSEGDLLIGGNMSP